MAPQDLMADKGEVNLMDLDTLVEMALEAYPTSHAAFLSTDKNDDGKVDKTEFAGLAKKLGLKASDIAHLFPLLDTNGDGFIDALEWADKFGVSLDGLRARILDKYGNADAGFKAGDKNKDGSLSGAEFFDHCKSVDVGPEDAGKLLKQVDKNGDGKISEKEYNAFGITVDELKKRARDKYGPPSKSF